MKETVKIKETEVNPNDFPIYVFHLGRNYKAQEFFGAHEVTDSEYVFFAVDTLSKVATTTHRYEIA